jgi:hypothetical protein
MKKLIFTLFLLIPVFFVSAQTTEDHVAIIQQVVDHHELQHFFARGEDGSIKQRYVLQYPTYFTEEVAAALNEKTAIVAYESELPVNAATCFRFRVFEIEDSFATINANLYPDLQLYGEMQMIIVRIDLQRTRNEWIITNMEINEF